MTESKVDIFSSNPAEGPTTEAILEFITQLEKFDINGKRYVYGFEPEKSYDNHDDGQQAAEDVPDASRGKFRLFAIFLGLYVSMLLKAKFLLE